jgi:hypothetical protein
MAIRPPLRTFIQGKRSSGETHSRCGSACALAEELTSEKSTNEQSGVEWIEMDDPDGHPFRVLARRPTQHPETYCADLR